MTDRITIEAARDGWTKGVQLSINRVREDGTGNGYRIAGPKFNGSSELLRKAELTERDAAEIRAMLDAVFPPAPLYVALYEGAAPALFSTPEAARAYCDDFAKAEARGRCWDWMPEKDGVQEQCWTHEDDDRPTHATGGTVTALRTDADN